MDTLSPHARLVVVSRVLAVIRARIYDDGVIPTAKLLGVTRQTVEGWRDRKARPSYPMCVRSCPALGLDSDGRAVKVTA